MIKCVIHCSDSKFGSSILIDKWHRERGWSNVGYHFVICNGQIENNVYLECMNGAIERGRDSDKQGAHAKGHNDALGICLIGIDEFTHAQFISLEKLLKEKGFKSDEVIGHYKVSSKTCPNFNVETFLTAIEL